MERDITPFEARITMNYTAYIKWFWTDLPSCFNDNICSLLFDYDLTIEEIESLLFGYWYCNNN